MPTQADTDHWVENNILRPARARWGPGWSRLSVDQRLSEIHDVAWRVLATSSRVDRAPHDTAEAAALGRHFCRVIAALDRLVEQQEEG